MKDHYNFGKKLVTYKTRSLTAYQLSKCFCSGKLKLGVVLSELAVVNVC